MLKFPVVTGRLAPYRFKFKPRAGGIEQLPPPPPPTGSSKLKFPDHLAISTLSQSLPCAEIDIVAD
jgi:hypothetical protein